MRAAEGVTLTNVPSMTLGREVTKATPKFGRDLLLEFRDGPTPVFWSEQPHIFYEVRRAGGRLSIVGFYHPMCRLLAGDYDDCISFPFKAVMPTTMSNLLEIMKTQAHVLTPLYEKQKAVLTYQSILAAAKRSLGRDPADLTFIHLPVPHRPQIWDPKRGEFREGLSFWKVDYRDNFALSDRALGEIRELMERNGTWDDAVVLITSDHGFDKWGNRDEAMNDQISFILKTPYQTGPLIHTEPFSGIVVKKLLLSLLLGDLTDARSVSSWLETQGGE